VPLLVDLKINENVYLSLRFSKLIKIERSIARQKYKEIDLC